MTSTGTPCEPDGWSGQKRGRGQAPWEYSGTPEAPAVVHSILSVDRLFTRADERTRI